MRGYPLDLFPPNCAAPPTVIRLGGPLFVTPPPLSNLSSWDFLEDPEVDGEDKPEAE